VGLPAILSIYFDIFSGALQAFIFAMLTMLYIAGAFSPEAFRARQEKKAKRKNKTEV
jgi:F-type H+-transporting ATPase subunit a